MADPLGGEAERLAAALTAGGQSGDVVSLQVADVTESGRVNLQLGDGSLLMEVACPDSYRNRAAGDWVAVRLSSVPVVLWRLGDDPAITDAEDLQKAATQAAQDVQVVRAATYGTGAPSGTGWQAATAVYVRKVDDKIEIYFQVPDASDPSPSTPGVPTPKPVTVSPTASGSWRAGRPDDYASTPVQGDWTGRGNRRGAWFYGSAIQSACAGKTVSGMKVQFTRKAGAGVNAKRPLHLYLHNYGSPPSGQLNLGDGPEDLLRLSAGAKGTATLPKNWVTALASGSAKGLAIYASGSSDYMAVTGGQITITFS
ncbi:hypothetical protein [Streptomyces sp. NBC_00557]|uniref:hypothetical protein n=1 Tax=Streptomyces sp. NBC_00557 TaxID=2975776 RepID=UPI002E7FCA6B|nr:hypothetical protein [Streptomyces sp. NBC_00557]WUC36411.1 hypothetical protein OG956_20380 [Streptomyces sp. NBC_00557]